jgi:hypothetical protein
MDPVGDVIESNVLELVRWWEKRRWWFNVAVGAAGLLASLDAGGLEVLKNNLLLSLIQVGFYGAMANLFYTLGWIFEVRSISRNPSDRELGRNRQILFYSGTICSVLLTGMLAILSIDQ